MYKRSGCRETWKEANQYAPLLYICKGHKMPNYDKISVKSDNYKLAKGNVLQACCRKEWCKVHMINELCTTQKETDTHMLFKLAMVRQMGSNAMCKSPDIDVAMQASAFCHQIKARILFRTGCKLRQKYTDITAAERQLIIKYASTIRNIGIHWV